MSVRPQRSILSQNPVVGEVFVVEHSPAIGAEIAIFALQLQSALAHHARRESGILLGRDVPVIRRCQIQSAVIGRSQTGREKAAHAFIGDGKRQPGRVDQRHILEEHLGIARRAPPGFKVELHVLRPEIPVPVTLIDRAGGETDFPQPGWAVLGGSDGAGHTPARSLAQIKLGILETACATLGRHPAHSCLQIKRIGEYRQARFAGQHFPRSVKHQLWRQQVRRAPLRDDIPLQQAVALGPHGGAIRVDEDPRIAGVARRQLRVQRLQRIDGPTFSKCLFRFGMGSNHAHTQENGQTPREAPLTSDVLFRYHPRHPEFKAHW